MKDFGGGSWFGVLEFFNLYTWSVFEMDFCISLILFGSKDEMSLYLWLMSAEAAVGGDVQL